MSNQERALFRFNAVPVSPAQFWLDALPAVGAAGVAGQSPAGTQPAPTTSPRRAGHPIPLSADAGHALAHTVSARRPMPPWIVFAWPPTCPRTCTTTTTCHRAPTRIRALGRPLQRLGLLFSLRWRQQTPAGSIRRELAALSCLSHGFIFSGSLAPAPSSTAARCSSGSWCSGHTRPGPTKPSAV